MSALSDARTTNVRKARTIIDNLPAVAWMAYSIHGNETSGADGALAAIYLSRHKIELVETDINNSYIETHMEWEVVGTGYIQ